MRVFHRPNLWKRFPSNFQYVIDTKEYTAGYFLRLLKQKPEINRKVPFANRFDVCVPVRPLLSSNNYCHSNTFKVFGSFWLLHPWNLLMNFQQSHFALCHIDWPGVPASCSWLFIMHFTFICLVSIISTLRCFDFLVSVDTSMHRTTDATNI